MDRSVPTLTHVRVAEDCDLCHAKICSADGYVARKRFPACSSFTFDVPHMPVSNVGRVKLSALGVRRRFLAA